MTNFDYNVADHPLYHPEGTVANHIALVTLKALLLTGEMDLVLAGLYHDWFKPMGIEVETKYGSYISNKNHAQQAADFVMTDDVRYFVCQLGGNPETVSSICRYHMGKGVVPRKGRLTPHIETFFVIDDMIGRYPHLTNGDTYFVGQSPIQQHFRSGRFTVTQKGTPKTYDFKDIPIFFTGKFSEIGKVLALIFS